MHKKVINLAIGAIILVSIIIWGLAKLKAIGPEKKDQTLYDKSETKKILPTCEELNLTDEQIDAAVAEALIGINDPWGNESDFQLLIDRIENKLNCTLQKSKDAFKAKYAQ